MIMFVSSVVVFIVQPVEINAVDQRLLEFHLWEAHKVPVLRKSMAQVNFYSYQLQNNSCIFLDGRRK